MTTAPPSDPVDRIRQALNHKGLAVRNDRGTKLTAQCPAHDDHKPSLDVTTGDDGKALVICRAGCPLDQILAKLDLRAADLFADSPNGRFTEQRLDPGQHRHLETTYPYTSGGDELIRKRRYRLADGTKTFRIQHRDTPTGAWRNGQGGLTADPYLAPALTEATLTRTVFVVEGEKDADRLTDLGLVATTNIGGAGKWPQGWGQQWFAGRNVAILADNDPPGHAHAQTVAADLAPHAATVRLVNLPDLPPKGDVSDWLDAGHTPDELKQLVAATPTWTPTPPPESRYKPFTVPELLALPDPEWLIDGLLPHGTVGMICGLPGSGKSYLALELACTIADTTRHKWGPHTALTGPVIYITGEGQWGLAQRIEAWQHGHPNNNLEHIRFIVAMPAADQPDQIAELLEQIDTVTPDKPPMLVIFDTLARLALGLEENSAGDMGKIIGVCEAIRDRYACSVALVHHTRKDGKGYRGSSALQAGISWQWDVVLNDVVDPNYIRVACERQKEGRKFAPITLTFEKWDETGYLVLSDRAQFSDRDVRLINALLTAPEATPRFLSDTQFPWFQPQQIRPPDIHAKAWRRSIKALVTQGFLEEQGTNRHLACRWTDFAAFTLPKLQSVRLDNPMSDSRISLSDTPSLSLGREGVREMSENEDEEF